MTEPEAQADRGPHQVLARGVVQVHRDRHGRRRASGGAGAARAIGSSAPWYATQFSLICRTTGAPAASAPATIASACSMPMTLNAPTPRPAAHGRGRRSRPCRHGRHQRVPPGYGDLGHRPAPPRSPPAANCPATGAAAAAVPSATACRSRSAHGLAGDQPVRQPGDHRVARPGRVARHVARAAPRARSPSPVTASSPSPPSETTTAPAPAARSSAAGAAARGPGPGSGAPGQRPPARRGSA